ncbi:hypothetical protein [Microbacterium sp. 2FI]|uniref:hypothetical protein n=1 Tax=Microbacterium sp. 2FI TaxID=2502193 RepID=UPI0010F70977|nr:hypothetical protein [Microbacterium sp. 2FI]
MSVARGGSGGDGVAAGVSPATELSALRRRAYGPDADIATDPVAQSRLAELEQLLRGDDGEEADPGDGDSAADHPADGTPKAQVSDGSRASDSDASDVHPYRRTRSQRIAAFVVAGVVVLVVGIGVGIALGGFFGIGAGIGSGSGVGLGAEPEAGEQADPPSAAAPLGSAPDLTLGIASRAGERGAGWASSLEVWGVMAGTMMPHESFGNLDLWTATGASGSRCLVFSLEGRVVTAECAGGNFDPVFDVTLGDRTRSISFDPSLPDGTVIRFVARTDVVEVWVREPVGQ